MSLFLTLFHARTHARASVNAMATERCSSIKGRQTLWSFSLPLDLHIVDLLTCCKQNKWKEISLGELLESFDWKACWRITNTCYIYISIFGKAIIFTKTVGADPEDMRPEAAAAMDADRPGKTTQIFIWSFYFWLIHFKCCKSSETLDFIEKFVHFVRCKGRLLTLC